MLEMPALSSTLEQLCECFSLYASSGAADPPPWPAAQPPPDPPRFFFSAENSFRHRERLLERRHVDAAAAADEEEDDGSGADAAEAASGDRAPLRPPPPPPPPTDGGDVGLEDITRSSASLPTPLSKLFFFSESPSFSWPSLFLPLHMTSSSHPPGNFRPLLAIAATGNMYLLALLFHCLLFPL